MQLLAARPPHSAPKLRLTEFGQLLQWSPWAAALRVFCVLSHIAVTELWNSGSGLESQTGVVFNEGLALLAS